MRGRSIRICPAAGNVPNVTKAKTPHQRYQTHIFLLSFAFCFSLPFSITSTSCHMVDVDTQINNDSSFFFTPTYHLFPSSPHQSSSDEESGESEGSTSLPPSKLAYREGIGVGEGVRRGRRSRPPSRPTAPPPSQKLLLQHQQNRKRATALELRLKKRVKRRS